jgi:hypothetical protein
MRKYCIIQATVENNVYHGREKVEKINRNPCANVGQHVAGAGVFGSHTRSNGAPSTPFLVGSNACFGRARKPEAHEELRASARTGNWPSPRAVPREPPTLRDDAMRENTRR